MKAERETPTDSRLFDMDMKQQWRIRTHDSIPSDLAGEMRGWREFVAGEGYRVELRDPDTREEVRIWRTAPADDFPTVFIEGMGRTLLLDKAVGRVVQALCEHSDDLEVMLWTIAESRGGAAAPSGSVGSETPGLDRG